MKKTLFALIALGVGISLQAGVIKCDYPVTEVQPVYKTVTKMVPHKECWDEQKCVSVPPANPCACEAVVKKTVIETKCKTTYEKVQEQILVGYYNYAIACNGQKIKKFAKCKLKTIKATVSY